MGTNRKIAITGAGGFVGSRLARYLIARGHEIHAIVRDPEDACQGAVNHVAPSLTDANLWSVLSECQSLVHLAWASTPNSSTGQPVLELENNLFPTLRLIQAIQKLQLDRVIFMSSGGAVPRSLGAPLIPDGTPIPRSYYGAAKAAAEQFMLGMSAQSGKDIVILRPTNLYGPAQPLVPGFGLIRTLIDRVMRNEAASIWGDGSLRKDYLYIDDFLDLLARIVELDDLSGPAILEAGSGTTHSINEVVSALEKIAGEKIKVEHSPGRVFDPASIEVNLEAVTRLTGWTPTTSLQDGLARVYAWALERYQVG